MTDTLLLLGCTVIDLAVAFTVFAAAMAAGVALHGLRLNPRRRGGRR